MSSKRIFSGTVASYLHTAVSMLSNLVLVPMYLLYFSKEEYGLWLVVLSIVSYLGFSNLGIAQSVSNFVASTNAKNDYDGIKSIVATGFWLYVSIIILVMMIIIGVVLVVPLEDFLNVPESLKDVVIPVLVISSAFFLLKLPLTIFNVTLRSLNLIYKEQLFGLLFTVIQFIGVIAVLWSDVGIVGLSVVYGVTGLLSGIVLFVYLHKLVPGFSVSRKFASKTMVRKLTVPGGYFFILQLAGGLIWATDNVIISAILGVAEVVPYAIAFKVFLLTIGIASVVTQSMLPSITAAYALNNNELLSNLYIKALKLCFGLGLLATFIMIGVGPDLMIMWIGIDNYVGDTTFYFFICLIFIQIILWPSDAILVGTTQHQKYALVAVLEGFINIGLSIWWIRIWGVAGVAAASLTARLFTNAWYMFYQAYVVTGVGMTVLVGNVLKLFITPISGVLIALFILNKIDLFGWYKIIINTSAICFIFILLFYFLSLNGSDRHEIKKFIKNFGLT
jgi:O-antigen/teichoic acid export membrane protein